MTVAFVLLSMCRYIIVMTSVILVSMCWCVSCYIIHVPVHCCVSCCVRVRMLVCLLPVYLPPVVVHYVVLYHRHACMQWNYVCDRLDVIIDMTKIIIDNNM